MNSASTLTLRGALSDPALRESLLASLVMLLASLGLTFVASWLWVLRQAARRDRSPAVDWLLVCGHVLEHGRPSAIFRQRLRRAAGIAAERPETIIVLCGGGVPSEASAGRAWLLAGYAIEPGRIRLEEASRDTFANLRHARDMLPAGVRVGVVTSRFHLARVLVYARQLGLDALAVPAESRWRFTPGNTAASLREAAFLCWFVCGRLWARLARRRRLLERIR